MFECKVCFTTLRSWRLQAPVTTLVSIEWAHPDESLLYSWSFFGQACLTMLERTITTLSEITVHGMETFKPVPALLYSWRIHDHSRLTISPLKPRQIFNVFSINPDAHWTSTTTDEMMASLDPWTTWDEMMASLDPWTTSDEMMASLDRDAWNLEPGPPNVD